MQLTFSDEVRIQTVSANALPYGECCRLVRLTRNALYGKRPSGDITAVYMKQHTNQSEVQIVKKDYVFPNSRTTKLMNLESGEIICVHVDTEIIPVGAKVVVSERR